VHVVYGVENLKTHCKLCLVVRREHRRRAPVSPHRHGQLQPDHRADLTPTSVCSPPIRIWAADVSDIFNYLTGYSRRATYRQLLVAPVNLRAGFLTMLERENHARERRPPGARHRQEQCDHRSRDRARDVSRVACGRRDRSHRARRLLSEARRARRERPHPRPLGGRTLSRTLARLLVRQRRRDELYMGSADLMERNLNRRVEAVCRVLDEGIVRHIRDVVLDAYLRDSDRAYLLAGNRY